MGLSERPPTLAQRQAVAAVGQIHLMRYYQDFFQALGVVNFFCVLQAIVVLAAQPLRLHLLDHKLCVSCRHTCVP